MLVYYTAIQTGLRSSELRSLSRGRLFLDNKSPYVTCKARSTKAKNRDVKGLQNNKLPNSVQSNFISRVVFHSSTHHGTRFV